MDLKENVCVLLSTNKSKLWLSTESFYVKGFAFEDDILLDSSSLGERTLDSIKSNKLDVFLNKIQGCFSLIVNFGDSIFLISDKLRSYPIFFYNAGKLVVSDEIDSILSIHKFSFDHTNLLEFVSLGYLSCFPSTLIKDVSYIVAGTYAIIDGKTKNVRHICYHSFINSKIHLPVEKLFDKAEQVLKEAFRRMLKVVNGKTLVIPLSGGYDSRLIACLCKIHDLKNVICYTYGRSDSFEVSVSKKVAEKLGYKWYYVEYTRDVWSKFINCPDFESYCKFSGNITSDPCLQELPALLQLKNDGIINNDCVIIPGYFADLLGGSKIPVRFNFESNSGRNVRRVVKLIFRNCFSLNELKSSFESKVHDKVESEIESISRDGVSNDVLDYYESYWFIKSKIANFIINAVRMYEFLGFDWYLPLADESYMDVWYEVPWEKKQHSKLYQRFLLSRYFDSLKVGYKRDNLRIPLGKRFLLRILELMPDSIHQKVVITWNRMKDAVNLDKRSSNDVNDFIEVASILYKDSYSKDYPEIKNFKKRDINAMMSLFYLDLLKKHPNYSK